MKRERLTISPQGAEYIARSLSNRGADNQHPLCNAIAEYIRDCCKHGMVLIIQPLPSEAE